MHRLNKRGAGSVIGALFMILILISGYTYYALNVDITEHYNMTLETMNDLDWDHNRENIVIEEAKITGSNTLNLTVENEGPILSHLIYLGVFNKTVTPEIQDYSSLNVYVDPTETVTNIGSSVNIIEGKKYIIQLATELGNIIEHDFYPASEVTCDLNLIAVPATAYNGNNVTVFLTVTHNDTDVDTIQSLTVSLEAEPAGLVTVKLSPNSLSVEGLQRGESAYFIWVYNTINTGTVTFNATYNEAPTGTYTVCTVEILPGGNDFVDNNASNVDSSDDEGSYSNFPAIKAGPDGIMNTLTEESTSEEGVSVTIDNVTTFADDDSSFSFSHTCTGTDRLLVVSVYCDSGDRDVTAVSYGGTTLNHLSTIVHSGGKPRIEVWYLTAPSTGSNTVSVSLSGGSDKCLIGAISYTDVNQTTPIQGTTTAQGSSTTPSVTVSTETGDLVQDAMVSQSSGSPSVGSGQTQRYNVELSGSNYYGTASTEEWDTSVTMSWSLSESKEWVMVGFSIVGADPITYVLDLEVQWTEVDYDESNEWLSIYGGDMDAEDLLVDVWNGAAWVNVLTDLESGWNSIDVSTYLTSATFTIRFRDSTKTRDRNQDSWEVDAAFLYVWS